MSSTVAMGCHRPSVQGTFVFLSVKLGNCVCPAGSQNPNKLVRRIARKNRNRLRSSATADRSSRELADGDTRRSVAVLAVPWFSFCLPTSIRRYGRREIRASQNGDNRRRRLPPHGRGKTPSEIKLRSSRFLRMRTTFRLSKRKRSQHRRHCPRPSRDRNALPRFASSCC